MRSSHAAARSRADGGADWHYTALLSTFALACASLAPCPCTGAAPEAVRESARDIPVLARVDVVVVGGSTWAVAAALSAAEHGASVFLAAPRTYLGDDLCGTLHLELVPGQTPDDPLARRIFDKHGVATPLHIKQSLDRALLDAKVRFLFGCFPSEVLRDATGQPAGVTVANRAGRQAVAAKVIVDATTRAAVARLAGADWDDWPAAAFAFERVTLLPDKTAGARRKVHALEIPMPDGSFRSFAEAEQVARDRTYEPGQVRSAEFLSHVPPDPITGRTRAADWRDARPGLGHFQPADLERIYVIGPCADVPRSVMSTLLRPTGLMRLGRRIGHAAARDAAALPAPTNVTLPAGAGCEGESRGETRENLNGACAANRAEETVPAAARALSVLGRYDVVVIGGGTAGAPAAIGAARQGARTLVVEMQEGLGGIGTLGLIGRPYHGKDIGFTREVPFPRGPDAVEWKMEWYRREIRKAGGEIWLGALGCGALVDGDRVRGAIVATADGRGVALADVVIDATGNADIAAAAGARTMHADDEGDIALQGAGLPARPLGRGYVNTDYLLVDEADPADVWRAFVGVRMALPRAAYDVATMIQSRERRRVVGDHVLRYLDQIVGRTYPDSIVLSESDYDSHGYPTGPFFALLPHDAKSRKANHPAIGGSCYTPYRALLPRGLDGLLVVGLGTSMERDAAALIRMQRDLQNQGYAAGVAAALAARDHRSTRAIDIRALQRHLVDIGNLPGETLRHTDNMPFDRARLDIEIGRLFDPDRLVAGRALAAVLAHGPACVPILRAKFEQADEDRRLTLAKILGVLGDRTGVPTLIVALEQVTAWDDKILQGIAAEYAHLPTPIDAIILALGLARDTRAVPVLIARIDTLDAAVTLSHHRALALALERLRPAAATAPLARLLAKPGMRGHAMPKLEPLSARREDRRREGALREIVLARALFRCGDRDGLGEMILREYERDLRGVLARHARAVLDAPRLGPPE